MVDVNEIYGGNYLNAASVKLEKLVNKPIVILGTEVEMIGGDTHAKQKIVLTLDKIEKKLALNKTNAQIITEAYGNETDGWVGKKIYLQLTKRQFQGNVVDAIGVVIMNG